ncbi:hypothetical protein [Acetobacter pasteurianus]|uniref:Uncharacterized protein n=1 Tax=Acetobacter pasteurianus NBRC 3188 TaxID=1226663 RepID=A0A401WYL4_ACEPA|nr:hypothetical protein [Acetobacter pasteurianus]GCD54403.1 hypothetical protein NBRC3188_3100 [Acetobacter pasteurianus NBRC 3188]
MNRSHVGVATSSGWTATRHYPLSVLAVVRKLATLVSGHRGGNERVCFQRDRQAIRDGLLMPCEGLSWDGRHDKRLMMTLHPYPHAIPIMSGAPVSRFSA